jgi:hypothetical protein
VTDRAVPNSIERIGNPENGPWPFEGDPRIAAADFKAKARSEPSDPKRRRHWVGVARARRFAVESVPLA